MAEWQGLTLTRECKFGEPNFRNCDGDEQECITSSGSIVMLCKFHRQAVQMVGELDEAYKKRSKRAREIVRYRKRKDGKERPFVGPISSSSYKET